MGNGTIQTGTVDWTAGLLTLVEPTVLTVPGCGSITSEDLDIPSPSWLPGALAKDLSYVSISASAGTVCVDYSQGSYLCSLAQFCSKTPQAACPQAALEGRAEFSTFSTQDDGSINCRDCSMHRCCLKVGFRASWNSHLESSCANSWNMLLLIYSVNYHVSNQLIAWLAQVIN